MHAIRGYLIIFVLVHYQKLRTIWLVLPTHYLTGCDIIDWEGTMTTNITIIIIIILSLHVVQATQALDAIATTLEILCLTSETKNPYSNPIRHALSTLVPRVLIL